MKAKLAGLLIILISIINGALLLLNVYDSTFGALIFIGSLVILGGLSKGCTMK